MNKKVIAILILTAAALVLLTLYAFGPLIPKTSPHHNPVSLKPAEAGKVAVGPQNVPFVTYHNKDVRENYYTVGVPQTWQVTAGKPGGYELRFAGGRGTVRLMDVPDNTTLELFVLSQEEPRLKKTLPGYQRTGYDKLTLNGAEAYQLTYQNADSGGPAQTVQTFITGPDQAGVVTLTARAGDFATLSAVFSSLAQTFRWEKQ
jgi:hypothetical protein